jgi:hypothetical protein
MKSRGRSKLYAFVSAHDTGAPLIGHMYADDAHRVLDMFKNHESMTSS